MKDPDCLYDAINDEVDKLEIEGLNEVELEGVKDRRKESFRDMASQWFEYGEYLTVEIDTELKTCVVIEK